MSRCNLTFVDGIIVKSELICDKCANKIGKLECINCQNYFVKFFDRLNAHLGDLCHQCALRNPHFVFEYSDVIY